VRNPGADSQVFRVMMRIDSGYQDSQEVRIHGCDSVQVEFLPWLALPEGQHTVKCSTMLANDYFRSDDARSAVFTVSATGAEEPATGKSPKAFVLSAPSPSRGQDGMTIRYCLPRDADMILRLYDAAGKLRATLDQGRRTAGPHTLNFRASRFPFRIAPGVYTLRLEVRGAVVSRKIIFTG
jgi:hypothetical protein